MVRIKNREYIIGAVVLILLGVIIWKTQKSNPLPKQEADAPLKSPAAPDKLAPADSNNLEGQLKISDDAKRGNLMLVMEDRTIYIFTARDYSPLLDKQVKLQIDGSPENFRLVDIKLK